MRLSDRLMGAGAVVAGAVIFGATLRFPRLEDGAPGPALFPQILGGLMALFGALLALRPEPAPATPAAATAGGERRRAAVNVAFVFGAIVAFMVAAPVAGFLLTTSGILFVLMWRLGAAPARAALAAVGLTLFVYVVFGKVLRVPLPLGLLWF
jgi:putative tricarboxylic transport membrane protein